MKRKEFIKNSAAFCLGFPFLSAVLLESCNKADAIFPKFETSYTGKVLIVGAGAAGLAAGYLLKRYGVDFEIVEAAPVYGGRLKKAAGLADFPLDVGAEWIHTHPEILADILSNPSVDANVDIIVYNPQTIKTWNNNQLKSHNYLSKLYSEWKFKSTTWFDFFEQYLVPEVIDNLVLNKPIATIDYSGSRVRLQTTQNEIFEADKVLITSSIKTLQNGQIGFQPALPATHTGAINNITMGDGIKIFIEFKERFYPDFLAFGPIIRALNEEEKFVYDAAFRKDSGKNILGLFAINEKATAYTQLNSEEAILQQFLRELDEMFEGKATPNYVQHVMQNWSAEPYIQGAYSYAFDGNQKSKVETLQQPVADKIYFAGEALSIANQATVHGACESAYKSVQNMLQEK